MQPRTFLHMCGLSVVIYGCGSDSAGFANFTGAGTPNQPAINPALARTNTEGIFAFDAQGNLYEVRPQTARVLRFDGQGPGQGKFRHARGIAIRAQDGLIAIADGVEGDIEFFSQDLVSLGFLTTPALQPRDLTFGPAHSQPSDHGPPGEAFIGEVRIYPQRP